MATKTLGIVIVVLMCIILLPIGIGILGGLFGLIAGLIGGVFGLVMGVFGALFGAIVGMISWIFEMLFGWDHDFNFNPNFGIILLIVVTVILLTQNKRK